MKKTITADQPEKTEPAKSEAHRQISIQKLFRDHKFCDHSHGRVNKSPIGINFWPGVF
jgi:hypothetical protein